ncbi:MAG: hypothetical protein GY818_07065 [Planctomycetaceae bacterium]|nr:hypothetical protein [Planctomycetaceae bacterium]
MIKVNTGLAPTWFTPSGEIDEETPTRFKIKPLNGFDFLEFCTEARILANGAMVPNKKGTEIALKAGLIDWENFVDHQEKAIKFSVHNFKLLPAEVLSELVGAIVSQSSTDEDDEKNS